MPYSDFNFSIDTTADDRFAIFSHFGRRRRVITVDNFATANRVAGELRRRVAVVAEPLGGGLKVFHIDGERDAPHISGSKADVQRRAHEQAIRVAHDITKKVKA